MRRKKVEIGWYRDFICPGGDCGLTCCCDKWTIELTDSEIELYKNKLPMSIKKDVCDAIDYKNKQFICENGKCKLLNSEGFCRIVLEAGEEYLSDTCTEFPRVKKEYGDVVLNYVEPACPLVAYNLLDGKRVEYFEESEES